MAEKERWKSDTLADDQQLQVPQLNGANGGHHQNATEKTLVDDDAFGDDDLEEQLEEAGIVRAPDGGYGWVVVFASFLANMIVDGVIFSISESIVPLWEKEFNATTSAVTIATSLLAGCYLLSGPLGSALANNFGCNAVAIAGSIIAASGLLLSVLVPKISLLYVTFGIIGGVGYGLMFLPAVVIVGQYFSERRALATGIAVCGSGIGTSLFSYINPIILNAANNNWRIFITVHAGISLLGIFVGYFFKPLQPSSKQIEEVKKITEKYIDQQHQADGLVLDGGGGGTGTFEGAKDLVLSPEDPTAGTKLSVISGANGAERATTPAEHTTSPHVAQGVAIERFERPASQSRSTFNTLAARKRQLNADRPFLSTIELHASRKFLDKSKSDIAEEVTKASVADLNRPLSKMDIFYLGSVSTLAAQNQSSGGGLRRRATTMAAAAAAAASRNAAVADSTTKSALYLSTVGLPDSIDENDDGTSPKWTRGFKASLGSLLDLSLLRMPSFLMLAIGGFMTLACFFVPFMFVGALAKQNGVDPSLCKYLVVILGLVNLAARVICGVIADHPKVDPLLISNVTVILGGLATAFAPFLTEFWMFAAYCVPFAFGVACFAALRSIICVELLGIEKLTNAYGMLMLFMGVAALIGPPFAALLKNLTNSFNASFYFMGALMTLSGVVSLPLRRVKAYEIRREEEGDVAGSSTRHELQPLNFDEKEA